MNGISILCPTRNRPDQLKRMIRSAESTAAGPVEFVLYCDNDSWPDNSITDKENVTTLIGKRITLSKMWNECQRRATYDIFQHAGDDIMFRTKGWDTQVAKAFEKYPDRIVFVGCNSLDWGGDLTTHGFLHRRWVETVGYFVPPFFDSDYNDKWLTVVAKEIGRHEYLEDVIIEHLHPIFGKAQWDRTYTERLNRHSAQDPQSLYDSMADQRHEDAEKLKAAME